MKILKLRDVLKHLDRVNEEIHYKNCVKGKRFNTGVISFTPKRNSDRKQIKHSGKDVLCHVIKGHGRLRVNRRKILLQPGTICHIPKGTPHDFAAGKKGKMILLYSLIST